MTVRKKNPGTWESTASSNVAYKRSWNEKVKAETFDLKNPQKQGASLR
jgi:hypothetical protein